MAQIARRLWSEIQTETLRRVGGVQYTNFAARLQYWIWEAYQKLCLTYNHYELQDEIVESLATGAASIKLPENCYSVMSVAEVDTAGEILLVLQNQNDVIRQGLWKSFRGQPQNYSRSGHLGTRLQFDCSSDTDRNYRICVYRFPDSPDFTAAIGTNFSTPQIAIFWEQAIIDAAVARAGASMAAGEVQAQAEAALDSFLGQQIQAPLVEQPPGDLPNTPKSDSPRGGLQG